MENNLSQDYTEDDNRMEPELEEYGNSNSDEFYFKLYDILRFPEEDVSDYIEDMEDVTLFYDEYSIRYILEKGFFCVDDVKGFSVRLRRCLANAKSRVIDDVSESEIINKNAANLLRFNPTNSCDKLALLTSGASKRIMARVNYFNKRDRVEELLKSSLKDHIALLASRKRCEDRANREIRISGFWSQGHPFDTLFENRRDYDISGDFEGFQRLLMDTQDAIEYLSNYQNELVENLLSALKYTKEDKYRQEQETKKAEEELTSAKEELRAVKEDLLSRGGIRRPQDQGLGNVTLRSRSITLIFCYLLCQKMGVLYFFYTIVLVFCLKIWKCQKKYVSLPRQNNY